MNLLVSEQEFEQGLSRQLFAIGCQHCGAIYHKKKHQIQAVRKGVVKHTYAYCSRQCQGLGSGALIECQCTQCDTPFIKRRSQVRGKPFCSSTCAGKYHAAHKKTGTRRSKLEQWIEQQLALKYPSLTILYNTTSVIEAELDIYIPSLQIAFELNGIFHYEPIFGQEKLDVIQNRDRNKFVACHDKDIGLCVIDTSSVTYHKPATAQPFLDIIVKIIDEKLAQTEELESPVQRC